MLCMQTNTHTSVYPPPGFGYKHRKVCAPPHPAQLTGAGAGQRPGPRGGARLRAGHAPSPCGSWLPFPPPARSPAPSPARRPRPDLHLGFRRPLGVDEEVVEDVLFSARCHLLLLLLTASSGSHTTRPRSCYGGRERTERSLRSPPRGRGTFHVARGGRKVPSGLGAGFAPAQKLC